MKTILKAAVAASALFAAPAMAERVDLTDAASYTTQTAMSASGVLTEGDLAGIGWTLTPNVTPATYEVPGPGPVGGLAGQNDGVGIVDDEIGDMQWLTLTFTTDVMLMQASFLDLFREVGNPTVGEIAVLHEGTIADPVFETFVALEEYQSGPGYAQTPFFAASGDTFTFAEAGRNDGQGVSDYALAAFTVAPIPLPAGVLLLGTALAGLGFARRRKA